VRERGALRTTRCAVALVVIAGALAMAAGPAFAVAPSPPTITSVTRGNQSIAVAFTPGATNGTAILDFTAACTPSGGGATTSLVGLASPITVTGLTNGTTYTCTVTATNILQESSSPSAPSAAVVPAAAPGAPTITSATGGAASIAIAFTPGAANGSSQSFSVSCTSLDGGTPGTNTGTASPITVSGLTNGKTYTCTLSATNEIGTTNALLPSLPTIPSSVPGAPSITSVTPGNASVAVAFNAPASNGGFPILNYEASCASSTGGVFGSNIGLTSPISVSGLTNGRTYTCTVTATNVIGTGGSSAPSSPVVPAAAPGTPAQPSVASGNAEIVVSVAAPNDNGSPITSYSASCTSSNGGVPGSKSDTAPPITVTGLTNDRTYTCTVNATNAVGTSGTSPASLPTTPSAAVTPPAVPDAPAAPTVTRGNGVFIVAFGTPADNGSAITSYNASCTSSNGGVTRTQSGGASPLSVSNISTGKSYRCTVSASNGVGTGPASQPSAAVVGAALPGAPTIASVAPASGAASVTFGPSPSHGSSVTSYSASCASSNGGVSGSKTGTASPLTVTGLSNAKTYTCTVTGTNAIGTGPASTPSNSFVVGSGPGAPVNVRAVPGPAANGRGSLRVSFESGPANGNPIRSYRARCRSLNGGGTRGKTGRHSPITIGGLRAGKTYLCTVAQTTASGTSAESSPARATVGAPALPAVLRELPLGHGIALPFTPPANNGRPITEYRSRCFTDDNVVRVSPPQSASPLIATNLIDGKSYVCVVTARNSRGVSPQTAVGPVVVGRPNVAARASCSGNAGSMRVTPGLATSAAKPQTFKLASKLGRCRGPYVRAASIAISFRSSTAISCRSALNVNSTGSGTIRWTAPRGMGKTSLTLRLVLTSTSGHTTKAHVYGVVTSNVNVFKGSHVSGDLTLDRGLKATSDGGDCSTAALTDLRVSKVKLRFS
jgi:Fibronectin type III domain